MIHYINTRAVAASLAVVTLLSTFSQPASGFEEMKINPINASQTLSIVPRTGASDRQSPAIITIADTKQNAGEADMTAEQILRGIAALPAKKVVRQQKNTTPPAEGGTETVVIWKKIQYTIWLWDVKTKDDRTVRWSRIYMRPVGTTSLEAQTAVGDANLDGKIDTASGNEGDPPSFLRNLDDTVTRMAITDKDSTPAKDAAAIAIWQTKYEAILKELADFLRSVSPPAKKARPQTASL